MLKIRTFGSLELTIDNEKPVKLVSKKAEALLVYLAIEPKTHARETLVALFWGDREQSQATANLRVALSSLRKSLPNHMIIDRETVSVNAARIEVDAQLFNTRLDLLRTHWAHEHQYTTSNLQVLENTLNLYGGSFLEGLVIRDAVDFTNWASIEANRFQRMAIEGMLQLVDGYMFQKMYIKAIDWANKIIKLDPLNERANRQLMRSLTLTGERNLALTHFENFRELLFKSVHAIPEEETLQIQEEIRSGVLHPETRTLTTDSTTNPYKGLFPFQEDDAQDFHGRETLTKKLIRAVHRQPITALIGPSGSGKTSIVQAGLVPLLKTPGANKTLDQWHIVSFRPGRAPMFTLTHELAHALLPDANETARLVEANKMSEALRAGTITLEDIALTITNRESQKLKKSKTNPQQGRVLLFVNQFEELYTLCDDPQEANLFINILVSSITNQSQRNNQLIILFTLRADFMNQAVSNRLLADAMQEHTVILGSMSTEEMRRAIIEPAITRGIGFETGLVDRILNEIGEAPGYLPLLEFTLTLLWEQRTGNLMTHSDYIGIGQVTGALARYAETVYDGLSDEDRLQARHIFTQLVSPGDGTEDTRRTASREELGGGNWLVAQRLADARLVVTNQDHQNKETGEIIHEALIKEWGRLQGWLKEDHEFRMWQEQLRYVLRQWQTNREDPSLLIGGIRLEAAVDWFQSRPEELSESEKQFIQQSSEYAERMKAEAKALQEQQLAAARQLAESERRLADEQRQRASMLARRNSALAAFSVLLILLLLLTAFFSRELRIRADENEALAALNAEIAATAQAAENIAAESYLDARAESLALGATLLYQTGGTSELIALLSLQSIKHKITDQGDTLLQLALRQAYPFNVLAHPIAVQRLVFSSDEQRLFATLGSGEIAVWDMETADISTMIDANANAPNCLIYHPDSDTVLICTNDNKIAQFDMQGNAIWEYQHFTVIKRMALSPLAAEIAFTDDADLYLMDIGAPQPKEIRGFDQGSSQMQSAAYSPDGRFILTGQINGKVTMWEAATGDKQWEQAVHLDRISALAFSTGGELIASGGNDGQIYLMDGLTGERIASFAGHTDEVNVVAFSPDGFYLVSGSRDRTVRFWELATGFEHKRLTSHRDSVGDLKFSKSGDILTTVSQDTTVMQWFVSEPYLVKLYEGHTNEVNKIRFSPDGQRILATGNDQTVIVWDAQTARQLLVYRGHQDVVQTVRVSPDGSYALTGAWSGNPALQLWDIQSGEMVRGFPEATQGALAIALSPDMKHVAAGGWDGIVYVWRLDTGELLHTLTSHQIILLGLTFSPDGQMLFTTAIDDTIWAYEIPSGDAVYTIKNPDEDGYSSLAISPDGRWLLVGSFNGRLYLHNVQDGALIRYFIGHIDVIWDVGISADGKWGLSASADRTARLWDLESGAQIRRFSGHRSSLNSATFSPDMKTILTAGSDQLAIAWNVDIQQDLELLCSRMWRDLTEAEALEYSISEGLPTCQLNK